MRWLWLAALLGCNGTITDPLGVALDTPDAGQSRAEPTAAPTTAMDRERLRAQFPTTTELVRYIVAPTCAAERNECHNSEDFPDLSTEANLWNLVGLRCNAGLGDRNEVEDFCEPDGDQLRIESGTDDGFIASIGRIDAILNDAGELDYYEVTLDTPVPSSSGGLAFRVLRDGSAVPGLGAGSSLETQAGSTVVRIGRNGIPDPTAIRQGDENGNGVWGAVSGVVVTPGRPEASYIVRRLAGRETERPQMPLGANADTATEVNSPLTEAEMYVITSWINCMQPGDGPYSPIRYDCEANADNDGRW